MSDTNSDILLSLAFIYACANHQGYNAANKYVKLRNLLLSTHKDKTKELYQLAKHQSVHRKPRHIKPLQGEDIFYTDYPVNTWCLMFRNADPNHERMVLATIRMFAGTPFPLEPTEDEAIDLITKRYGKENMEHIYRNDFEVGHKLRYKVQWRAPSGEWVPSKWCAVPKPLSFYTAPLGLVPLHEEEKLISSYSQNWALLVFETGKYSYSGCGKKFMEAKSKMVIRAIRFSPRSFVLPEIPAPDVWITWLENRYGCCRDNDETQGFYHKLDDGTLEIWDKVKWIRGSSKLEYDLV